MLIQIIPYLCKPNTLFKPAKTLIQDELKSSSWKKNKPF